MSLELSIVVPVYNTPVNLLRQCCESLDNSTNSNTEILLIDDGSTTLNIESDLAEVLDNPKFILVKQDNTGVSSARNLGISRSQGQWIIFVDPDDIFVSNKSIMNFIHNELKSDVILFGYQTFNLNGIISRYDANKLVSFNSQKCSETLFHSLLEVSNDISANQGFYLGTPWAKAFRRDFLLRNRIEFDVVLKKRQDALFCATCYSKANAIAVCDDPSIIYAYRKDNEYSITKKYNPEAKNYYSYLLNKMIALSETFDTDFQESLSMYAYDLLKELINLDFCNVNNENSFSARRKDFLSFRNSQDFSLFFTIIDTSKIKAWKKILYYFEYHGSFMPINLIYISRRIYRLLRSK